MEPAPKKPRLHPVPSTSPSNARTEASHTVRAQPWTYIHLTLLSSSPSPASKLAPIDELTARTCLTAALRQFLGLTGEAVAIDILKVCGRDVWIRTAREDGRVVVEAVSGWAGGEASSNGGGSGAGAGGDGAERVAWRVRGRSDWLGALVAGDGSDLFEA